MADMNRVIVGSNVAAPAANYAHAVLSDGRGQMLHTAGIVGVRTDGSVPAAIGDQAEVIWTGILALLAEAEMVPTDIVSVTTYVVASQLSELGTVMRSRDHHLSNHLAASTLVTVPALARPEWLMEISVVAVSA